MVINECLVISWVLHVGKAVVSNLHGTIIIMNLAQNVLSVLSKCVPSWSACWQQPSHAQISVRTKIAFFGAHLPGLDLYIAKF